MASYQLIGLGTYKLQDDMCIDIIESGLKIGYRQIDTAQLYHNHNEISLGIKKSCTSREEIFIISKIHNSNIRKLKISESIENIKKDLDTDYIDLILLHNPVKNYEYAWNELIRCKEQMNIKNIGVSNFDIEHLNKIISSSGITPWLNQLEVNIFNQQQNLIEFNKSNNIISQSHTSLTKGHLLNNKDLIEFVNLVNTEYNNTINNSDLMFKFLLDQDIGILPKTTNHEHLIQNYNLLNKKKIFDLIFYNNNAELIKNFEIKFKIY